MAAPKKPKAAQSAWKDRSEKTHAEHIKEIATNGAPQVVLLGSSMFERWKTTGKDAWAKEIAPLGLNVLNAGVGGDKTQNVLYRMEQGLFKDIKPAKIVLQIGTNNLETGDTAADIVAGIHEILQRIVTQLPDTKVVVYNLFPRTFTDNGKPLGLAKLKAFQDKILATNVLLETLVEKTLQEPRVSFRRFGWAELQKDNEVFKSFYDDHVHLSVKGYEVWVPDLKAVLQL